MADSNRSYTAGHFMLNLGGKAAGYIKSCSGGNISAEVAVHNMGPENFMKKHISTIKYQDFTCEVGASNSEELWKWIQSSLKKNYVTMDGSVVAADFNYCAMSERQFTGAVLTEFGFPELNAKTKEALYATVKFSPERIQYLPGDGKQLKGAIGPVAKKWLVSNFRVSFGGLPCDGISKVGAWTWKQSVVEDAVGQYREPTKHPAKVEVPDMEFEISMKHIKAWEEKFTDFVIRGNCAEENEVEASIELLAPDMKSVIGHVDFFNCGLKELEPVKAEANQDEIARFKVKWYCERIEFFPQVMDKV